MTAELDAGADAGAGLPPWQPPACSAGRCTGTTTFLCRGQASPSRVTGRERTASCSVSGDAESSRCQTCLPPWGRASSSYPFPDCPAPGEFSRSNRSRRGCGEWNFARRGIFPGNRETCF